MLKMITALLMTLTSLSAFAMNLQLPEGDVASIAEQMRAKVSKRQLSFSPVGNLSTDEFHQSIDTFFRLTSEKMECSAETSKSPMTFDCQIKHGTYSYDFQATGVLYMDNGQIIGVSLDDSSVTVFIKK